MHWVKVSNYFLTYRSCAVILALCVWPETRTDSASAVTWACMNVQGFPPAEMKAYPLEELLLQTFKLWRLDAKFKDVSFLKSYTGFQLSFSLCALVLLLLLLK